MRSALFALAAAACLTAGCKRYNLSAADCDALADHMIDLTSADPSSDPSADVRARRKADYRGSADHGKETAECQKTVDRAYFECAMKETTIVGSGRCKN